MRLVVLREHVVGHMYGIAHFRRGHQVHFRRVCNEPSSSLLPLRTSSCKDRGLLQEVVLHGAVIMVERPSMQRGRNRVWSGAKGGTARAARRDGPSAKGRQHQSGADAKPARHEREGGGGISHLDAARDVSEQV